MRWEGRRESENVEDQRGRRPMGRPLAVGGGIGTILIVLVLSMVFGVDPAALLNQQNVPGVPNVQQGPEVQRGPEEERLARFVRVVLADTEDVWTELFRQGGEVYPKPTLVLFSGSVQSACGMADAAMGPFYCPADQKLYIDLQFLDEMGRKFGAEGDFAQAYVVAHEVGHHVQNVLGKMDEMRRARMRMSKEDYNDLSVRLELQADFYAGVWAHHAQKMKNILERGDIEEALDAAAAVGDDKLQRSAQGYVVPESFTHGTSAQRAKWFRKGIQTGDMRAGDTFSVTRP